jgi:SAM-dependent methyltransferase
MSSEQDITRPKFRMVPRDMVARTNAADVIHLYYWPVVGALFQKRCQMLLDVIAGRRYGALLEVAYGSGILLPSLAGLCQRLCAIDLHKNQTSVKPMLDRLHVEAELHTGDALHMPFEDGAFDCVVSLSMLEHLTDPGAAIDEMLRVLKPGGVLGAGFPVRNPWMDLAIRMFGFDTRKIHPSSHRDILKALEVRRLPYTVVQLPRGVPLDFSLYCCCAVGKE